MTSEKHNITVDGRKVTWGYTRKRNLGNYESEDVSLYVSDVVPDEVDNIMEWTQMQSESAINTLKAEVWAGLGLEFEFTETGEPKLVNAQPKRPGPAAPATPAGTGVPPPVPPPTGNSRAAGKEAPSMAQPGYYADFPGFCKECGAQGIDKFYDNRADVDGRIQQGVKIGPDFKCKNCNNSLWRPGSYDYNQALNKGAPQQQAPAPTEPPY